MSVGHVARLLEAAGIATVVVSADPFAGKLRALSLPRVLVTPHPMGRVFGMPGDAARQQAVLTAALELLETASENGAWKTMAGPYFARSGG